MKLKKIIIAMPIEDEFKESISRWGHEFNWSKCETHFVHVVRKNFEVSEMSVRQVPDNQEFDQERSRNIEFFKKMAHEMMPAKAFEHSHFEIMLETSPADALVEYAKKIQANMIVVATRKKKGFMGFFTSSFAERMLAISPCDVLILRPQ